jgi:hypothetical protein
MALTKKQAKMVIEMDNIARCINDENIFDSWLMGGVPDGDIPYKTTISMEDIDEVAEMYDEYDFKVFVGCFLRCMESAGKDGLYVDGVFANNKN